MHNDVMSNFGHKKSFPDIKFECHDCVRENDALTGPTPGICLKNRSRSNIIMYDYKVMKAKITSILKYDWIGQVFIWHLKPSKLFGLKIKIKKRQIF